jgi:hypothetical protein
MSELSPETFAYGYMAFRREALIDDDELSVRHGLRSHPIRLSRLTHLYLQSLGNVQMLWLVEQRSHRGPRTHRIAANAGDPGFLALVESLVAKRPDIDLRGEDEKQALRRMGVRDRSSWLGVLLLLAPVLVGVAMLPWLLHGLDFGEERVSVTSLSRGRVPGSRNVVITGARARLGESVEVTTSRTHGARGAAESTRTLIPLVPPSWDRTQPVHALLEVTDMSSSEESAIERATKFRGIVRDILWEGLSKEDRAYLTTEAGLKLADDVRLVEYRANPRYDLLAFLGGTGVCLLVVLAMGTGLWLRKRRGEHA